MKLLSKILVLLALCSWAVPGLAQTSGIINGATPIVGGTTGQCVTRGSNGTVLMAACGGSSVSTFSAGTTGFTPNSATSGAVTLAGTLVGANGGTGVANTGKTITLGGNLVTSGAFATTFTSTATTSVTLPTTGTLATLAGSEALTNKTINGQTITAGSGTLTLGSVTLNAGAGGTLGSNAFTSTAYAPLASPTFTGVVTMPTPFTLGAVSVTSTGTQLNYLAAATGTTGTTSTNVVFSTSPTLVTPVLGAATGTSLALGGATLGSNVFSGVGTAILTGATTTGPDWEVWITGDTFARAAVGVNAVDGARLSLGPGNVARDVFIERAGAANKRSGGPDAAAPIAQIDSVQNVVVGTSNTAGAARSYYGSQSTGTGLGGSHQWYVSPAGSTGTAVNALALALTIDSTKLLTVPGAIALGGATIGSNALAVTGTSLFGGNVSMATNSITWTAGADRTFLSQGSVSVGSGTTGTTLDLAAGGSSGVRIMNTNFFILRDAPNPSLIFQNSNAATTYGYFGMNGSNSYRFGTSDSATPAAVTLGVSSVVAGTSNTAGVNTTFAMSQGTGTGLGGSFIVQVAPAGSTGTAQNALATALTIDSTKLATFAAGATLGGNIQITSTGTDLGVFNGSAAGTTGMVAGSAFTFASSIGSYLAMRGNTYAGNANQRGNVYIGAGNPSAPGAAEGSLNFATGADVIRMTITGLGSVVLGSAALATSATDGFLYIPTSAGTPTGVPTTATGRVALIYDTTNHQFWIYDGGWKQPKTPAAAAIVTWQ